MKNNKFICFVAILCVLSFCNIEVKNVVTVNWNDFPIHTSALPVNHAVPLHVCPPDFIEIRMYGCTAIPVGESREFVQDWSIRVYQESINDMVPVQPKPQIKISFRKITAIKPTPMLYMVVLGQKRNQKVIMYNPPAFNPVHAPAGVSMLTSVLRKDGHDVQQRWGHIIGLEYMLLAQNKNDVSRALATIRSPNSNIHDLYEARQIFEKTSESISTKDKFRYERNNVIYSSQYQDGTVRGVLNGIADRKNHFWYPYFAEVEIPTAREFNPHVYGISIGDERQLFPGLILASMVKDTLPDCTVVLGGNLFARISDPNDFPDFVELFNYLDAIVYAEGFQPLQHIVDTLDVSQASGTIWKNGARVVKNPRTTSPTEFDSLPTPAFDGNARQWSPDDVATLYAQSHCLFACTFCPIPAGSDTYADGRLNDRPKIKPRVVSPRHLAENMRAIGTRKFDIVDEVMMVQRQLELGNELKAIGYPATWQCYLTVTDNLLKPELALQMYDAGCRSVQLGLETLSPESLKMVDKQWNHPSGYNRILQNFRDAGIHTHVFLIVGLPSEPLYEGLRTVAFLEKYGHNILTIKSGRWRPARYAPEVERGTITNLVELYPDIKPLQGNRSFRYRSATHSNTKVDAMRDIVEQACRRHWAYNVTSTIPWWINRSRYTWEQLEEMAKQLPSEPDIPHLDDRIAQMRYVVRTEMKREDDANFRTWEELAAFAVTLL